MPNPWALPPVTAMKAARVASITKRAAATAVKAAVAANAEAATAGAVAVVAASGAAMVAVAAEDATAVAIARGTIDTDLVGQAFLPASRSSREAVQCDFMALHSDCATCANWSLSVV